MLLLSHWGHVGDVADIRAAEIRVPLAGQRGQSLVGRRLDHLRPVPAGATLRGPEIHQRGLAMCADVVALPRGDDAAVAAEVVEEAAPAAFGLVFGVVGDEDVPVDGGQALIVRA